MMNPAWYFISSRFSRFSQCLALVLVVSFFDGAMAQDFASTLKSAEANMQVHMQMPPTIPKPKDAGGGYTHEKHKENAKLIYQAGALYKLTGKRAYARFAEKMMRAYAQVYPNWGIHPARKEQSPGRMFWQNLNESWWLVHVAQGFDAVQHELTAENKAYIETRLLRNMAEFLSQGSPSTFNKIHNHGTWATAAVGITGYALGDKDYSDKALLGLDKSGNYGFLKQLDKLFSPDGYYNEGPYYQRYALMPFVLFGQAVQRHEPSRKIFAYRDGILKKAIYTTIHLNYNGLFFPINDAIKDKSIATTELLHAVAIAYALTGDHRLLSVAAEQGKFVLTPESRALSRDLKAGKTRPFDYRSMRLSDGADGRQGALDILRTSKDPKGLTVIAKNTSQGLGHGHFDKLGLLVYDAGHEILRDYGAARFLNVAAKYGGHYLPENTSYAKQTIAHNALVVDETSHFGGRTKIGNKFAPQVGAFIVTDNLKATSAEISTAYAGVTLRRTLAVIEDAAFENPVIVDIVGAISAARHTYDLPFHYNGHLIATNFDLSAETNRLQLLGRKNGYQHLWKKAVAEPVNGLSQVTWLLDRRFYTVSTAMPVHGEVIFVETGASDPNFNLRREAGFILRAKTRDGIAYASIIEPHGEYNPTVEYTHRGDSLVKAVEHLAKDNVDIMRITTHAGQSVSLVVARDPAPDSHHTIELNGQKINWRGPYHLLHSQRHLEGKK